MKNPTFSIGFAHLQIRVHFPASYVSLPEGILSESPPRSCEENFFVVVAVWVRPSRSRRWEGLLSPTGMKCIKKLHAVKKMSITLLTGNLTYPTFHGKFGKSSTQNPIFGGGYVIVPWRVK